MTKQIESVNTAAERHGREDAQTWMGENPRSEWADAIKPGVLGADEALINALGYAATCKLFGIDPELQEDGGTPEVFHEACRIYSRAWRNTVSEAIEQIALDNAPVAIGPDGYPEIAAS